MLSNLQNKKIKTIENEQVATFSNPSVFQFQEKLKIVLSKHARLWTFEKIYYKYNKHNNTKKLIITW